MNWLNTIAYLLALTPFVWIVWDMYRKSQKENK